MEADLILYVVDASETLDEDDQNIIPLLEGKKAIILLNKSDLENKITEESLKETLEKVLEHTGEIQILRTSTIDPFRKIPEWKNWKKQSAICSSKEN